MNTSIDTNHINLAAIATKRKLVAITNELTNSQLDELLFHVESFISTHLNAGASEQLSKREREVLILLSQGYNRREIGFALHISANTAASHITNIYQKIDVSSVAEATRYAMTHKI